MGRQQERSKSQAESVPVVAPAEVLETVDAAVLGGMVGAACHAFALAGAARTVAIPSRDLSIPLLHPRWKWVALGLAVAVLVLGAVEISLSRSLKQAEEAYLQAARLHEGERDRLAGSTLWYKHAKELEEEKSQALEALRQKGSELTRRRNFLEHVLARREALVPALLDAVSSATPSSMMIRRLEEEGKTIRLEGWALENAAIQDFANGMSSALRGHGLRVDEVSVRAQAGPGDLRELQGYGFYLSLLLDPEASISGQ